MYNKKKLFLIFGMVFLFAMILSFGSAQPPFETNAGSLNGLQIFYPQFDNIPQNMSFNLELHVSNLSNGFPMQNTNIDCFVHLYNATGQPTFESSALTKDANGLDHVIYIKGGNFSDIGEHLFYTWCNNSVLGGEVQGTFFVTESGIEMTNGRSLLAIGLLGLLVLFLFLSLYSLFKIEDYKGKFALYWVSHVLLILVCFVAWQTGVEGLLSGMALTGIFRIFFWIFTISAFPMLLLSIAWVFYIHTVNDHTKKLMEDGEDPETAFSMAKKKMKRRRY